MADRKLLAGHAVRRLRRRAGLTQAAMAEMLVISPSYLNLVEKNQRPLSAALLVKLAETFDFDPRALAAGEPGGGAAAIRRRLADPMFADLEIDRNEVEEWLAGAPASHSSTSLRSISRSANIGSASRRRSADSPPPGSPTARARGSKSKLSASLTSNEADRGRWLRSTRLR